MKYSFDTSALIEGNKIYPIDVFPALWDKLATLINDGHVRAIVQVKTELSKKDDDIFKWSSRFPDLFLPLDSTVQAEVRAIMKDFPNLVNVAANKSTADPFVIALAHVKKCAVVTYEKPGSIQNPKIPFVCNSKSVAVMNLVKLMQLEGWSFR